MSLNPFKRDAAPVLEKTRAALAEAEGKIAQLETERDAALLGEGTEEIIRLTRLLDEQRRTAVIHRDRIAALEVDVCRQEWQRREKERIAAIEQVLEPFAAECAADAVELEVALGTAIDVFQRLEAKRAGILADWPPAVPQPRFFTLQFSYLERDLFQCFTGWDGGRFVHEVRSRLPKISESVRDQVSGYISRCREVSIVPPEFAITPEPEAEIELEDVA